MAPSSGSLHRVARDAVRAARPDDDVGRTVSVPPSIADELDDDAGRVHLDLRRRDAALDHPAERREMLFEDALGLVLRQAALELAAAVEAVVAHRRDLGHARAVQPRAPDVLGRVEERLQQADGVENLEGAGLDRGGARLAVRAHLPLDEPRPHTMASELGGGEQPDGPAPMIRTSLRAMPPPNSPCTTKSWPQPKDSPREMCDANSTLDEAPGRRRRSANSGRGDLDAVTGSQRLANHFGHPLLDGTPIGEQAPDRSRVGRRRFRTDA